MVVFLMEKVPVSLRGEITRWMLELRPGVFVGNISALVREKLWEAICQKLKGGADEPIRFDNPNSFRTFCLRVWR